MEGASSIFRSIKPKCVELAEITLANGSSSSLQRANALKGLDDILNQSIALYGGPDLQIPISLADYIMVPLTGILKRETLTDTELEHVLSIIFQLLKFSWCKPGSLSNELFNQYIVLLTFLVGGKPGQFSIKKHSDETFQNGINCIHELVKGALNGLPGGTQSVLHDQKYMPTFGHLLTILLNISTDSHIPAIKVSALETINSFFYLVNDGEILSLFFPGTVSTIAKIIKSKPHSNVMSQSFRTLSTLVNFVFSDFSIGTELRRDDASLEALKAKIESSAGDNNDLFELSLKRNVTIEIPEHAEPKKVNRTFEWLETTMVQFNKALKIILNIDFNRYDKFSVRDSLFEFEVKMIRNCFLSCHGVIPLLLRSLSNVCAVDQSFYTIATDSILTLSEFELLKSLIKDIITEELHAMQYNFISPDPTKAENSIRLLTLLTHILDASGETDDSLTSAIILKLQENLSYLFEIKASKDIKKVSAANNSITSIESEMLIISKYYALNSFEITNKNRLFEGIFTASTEEVLMKLIAGISTKLTSLNDFNIVSLDPSPKGLIRSSIRTWIVSHMIVNTVGATAQEPSDFLLLDNDSTNSTDTKAEQVVYDLTYSTLESSLSILQYCSTLSTDSATLTASTVMCLRSINNSITILGDEFKDELIDVLYPVVECLASSNEVIRGEAQLVTIRIANMLYGGSIKTLLYENSDYLVDALSFRLVGDVLTPKVPLILSVLVNLGTMDIISTMDDVIRTIFTLLDTYHSYTSLCEGFFLFFNELISKVYVSLDNFDFTQLETDLEEDNVMTFSMWGLKSEHDVEEFVSKKSLQNEYLGDSDDEKDIIDEPVERNKFLDIDSDDEDDDGRMSVPSIKGNEEGEEDDDKWMSPLDVKLYLTISNILSYAERLLYTKSTSLTILLLKTIAKIIPLLATQKSKFLPAAVRMWEMVTYHINKTSDFRIMNLCFDVLEELIRYGNTFFASRFIDFVRTANGNKFIRSLISKQLDVLKKLKQNEMRTHQVVLNQTSTSINWETETYRRVAKLFVYALGKLGRFIPIDVATSIIGITLPLVPNPDNYGYFDDLAYFLKDFSDK